MSDDKKPQQKAGRPSKYDPKFCDRVLEFGAEGRSKFQIAARLGVTCQTLLNWMGNYPEFKQAMEEAEDLSQGWWEDVGQEGLRLGSRDFNAMAFQFQMKNRFKAYRDVSTHQLTGPNGEPLTGDQPSSGDLAKVLMFLFGEGTVMVPKSGQTNEIRGPEINGALSMIGNSSAPAEPTTTSSALPSADAAEAQQQDSATPQPRMGLAPGESEVFDNGAAIVLDAERKKYAIFDKAGTFHNWRRDYSAACEFARTLK